MSAFLTYEFWEKTFKPIKNSLSSSGEIRFETFGEEAEFVKAQRNENVWTEVYDDNGTYIVAGSNFVNRLNYFITEVAWSDEDTEVPIRVFQRCKCVETDEAVDYGFDPLCDECVDGIIDLPCSTDEDLERIPSEFRLGGE